jgi:hypothetical protein
MIELEPMAIEMMASLQSAEYVYDGDGNLVKSIGNEVVTYYAGRHYHKTVDGVNVTVKKYYAIGMTQIAVRTIEGESDTLNWVLTDHLSSASVIANADGTLFSEVKYTAYGEIRPGSGSLPTKYQYCASTLVGHRAALADGRERADVFRVPQDGPQPRLISTRAS